MKEKNGVLQGEETLWDVALRGIGIQLPDEYVLRFCALMKKYGDKDLPNITLSDMAEIEHEARHELERRMKKEDYHDNSTDYRSPDCLCPLGMGNKVRRTDL